MSKIKELFGKYCDGSVDLSNILLRQICPFSGKKCFKTRKSNPDISIGTCTVHFQNDNIIICPNRLLENNQVFIDCLHLLTLHEPGNELYVVPEISIPGGSIDFFLVSAKDKKVKDFAGIEFQTMDTTGTVWPERQRLLYENGININKLEIKDKKSFGINWKMTAKTILVQMHHKSKTFENIFKHLVLIIQKPFFNYINKEFLFTHVQGVKIGDSVHIHVYDLKESSNKFKLSLDTRVSTDFEGISKSLGLKAEHKVELKDLIKNIESKLKDEYRLNLNII